MQFVFFSQAVTSFVCFSVDLMSYVTKFQWDKAKYPTALPLSSLADIINKVQTKAGTPAIYYCTFAIGVLQHVVFLNEAVRKGFE